MKNNLPSDYPEVEIWLVIRYLHDDGVNVTACRDEQKARTYAFRLQMKSAFLSGNDGLL